MPSKYSNQTIKYINQRNIITLLCTKKAINQVDIAKEISASLPTVITNVSELVRQGVLRRSGVGSSRGGRKPIIVKINPYYRYVIGIDFLVDAIKIILFNFTMEAVVVEEIPSSRFINFDDVMAQLTQIIKDILLLHNITLSHLLGIGISIPGIVNEDSMNIVVAPNLHIANTQLQQYHELFGLPVYFENEANAACYAEWQVGAAKGSKNVLYMSIMKGVGGGIIINNYPYRGEFFKAGEIGHIVIHRNGRKCTCGEDGCLNEYISVDSIVHEFNVRMQTNAANNIAEFMRFYQAGNEHASDVWNEYVRDFTFGLKSITTTIDPEVIVIGGEIARYSELLIPAIQKEFEQSKSNIVNKCGTIIPSKLMENAAITGVALYLRNTYIKTITSPKSTS
jgi:predicted NBD/HSP70 family sugar kinase